MAHTNSTPNYNLPQFLPTDKPAWLVDVNPAYASIDTAIKNASDAAGDAQADATQALSDAAGAQAIATQANSKADGAIASIAEAFLDTATYTEGEYVTFNNILYICTEPVTTPGPWTGSANWARASIDSISSALDTKINNVNSKTGAEIQVGNGDTSTIASKLYTDIREGNFLCRKWNNGDLEVWGSESETITDPINFTGWGGIYSYQFDSMGAYPVPFTRLDVVIGSATSSGSADYISSVSGILGTPLTTAPKINIIRGTSSVISAGTTIRRSIYARGKWN